MPPEVNWQDALRDLEMSRLREFHPTLAHHPLTSTAVSGVPRFFRVEQSVMPSGSRHRPVEVKA